MGTFSICPWSFLCVFCVLVSSLYKQTSQPYCSGGTRMTSCTWITSLKARLPVLSHSECWGLGLQHAGFEGTQYGHGRWSKLVSAACKNPSQTEKLEQGINLLQTLISLHFDCGFCKFSTTVPNSPLLLGRDQIWFGISPFSTNPAPAQARASGKGQVVVCQGPLFSCHGDPQSHEVAAVTELMWIQSPVGRGRAIPAAGSGRGSWLLCVPSSAFNTQIL